MRKAIIAAIVASALFAVGAFAANFAVESEDIASGSGAVTACADSVDIDFENVQWNNGLTQPEQTGTGDWETTSAVVRFYENTGTVEAPEYGATDACSDFNVTVRVHLSTDNGATAGGPDDVTGTAIVGPTNNSVNVYFAATQVSLIERASVLVDGEEFTLATS